MDVITPDTLITASDVLNAGGCFDGVMAWVVKNGSPTAMRACDAVEICGGEFDLADSVRLDGCGHGDGDGDGYGYGDGDGYGGNGYGGNGYGGNGYGGGNGDGNGGYK